MIEDDDDDDTPARKAPSGRRRRLLLGTAPACRRALARVIRGAWMGEIDLADARSYAYCIQILGGLFKNESDMSIDARLAELEEKLEAKR
jgi:hypothetical protein